MRIDEGEEVAARFVSAKNTSIDQSQIAFCPDDSNTGIILPTSNGNCRLVVNDQNLFQQMGGRILQHIVDSFVKQYLVKCHDHNGKLF